jgi:hypothetical protein
LIRVGLTFLILAGASHVFLRSRGWLSPDLVDGLTGLCSGVAIGTLVLAISRSGRQGTPAR